MIKTIVRILMVLIAVAMVGYIVLLKWPKASIKNQSSALYISASDLYLDYTNDETKAASLYYDKVITVEGSIMEHYVDENGAPVVILGIESPSVLATLEPSEATKVESLKSGSSIRIKGLCTGMLMEVTLNKGVIIN
ncbi:MAG: hypothetical protein AAFQ02_04880 [Bacteroidota bacterium]